MHREYNFIDKLNTDDISYIMDQKKIAAAVVLQRGFRSLMELRSKAKLAKIKKELD
jgi:hypothetical protein